MEHLEKQIDLMVDGIEKTIDDWENTTLMIGKKDNGWRGCVQRTSRSERGAHLSVVWGRISPEGDILSASCADLTCTRHDRGECDERWRPVVPRHRLITSVTMMMMIVHLLELKVQQCDTTLKNLTQCPVLSAVCSMIAPNRNNLINKWIIKIIYNSN